MMWTIDLFVDELRTVREALELTLVHLLGISWGGMLAMEYALRKPQGVESLILGSSPPSVQAPVADIPRLIGALPAEVREAIRKNEQAGTTDDPSYQEAMQVFYRRHLCRSDPWPECLNRALAKLAQNPEVFHTMFGPSELCCTGTLQECNITNRTLRFRWLFRSVHLSLVIARTPVSELMPRTLSCAARRLGINLGA
jgi:proline-specific peptidase